MATFKARLARTAIIASVAGNVITLTGLAANVAPEANAKAIEDFYFVDVCTTAAEIGGIAAQVVPKACAAFLARPDLGLEQCSGANLKAAWTRKVPTDECDDGWKTRTGGRFTGVTIYD